MIEIWTEELSGKWKWSPDNYLGGTPELIVQLAKNLKDTVIVYYDGVSCEHNGVYYLSRDQYVGDDILIAFNSVPPKLAKYNIYSTNWFHARQEEYMNFDERIVQSPYHQSIFGYDSRIIPLSCYPQQFNGAKKTKGQCLFSSSPDRGAEFLDSIWLDVKRETDATLIKTYDKSISEEDMIELYNTSEFWLHPGEGIELFCISAVKAQVAKCIPVVIPNMALETTVKYGVKTTRENYKQDLINAIKNPPSAETVDFGSWKDMADSYMANIHQGVLHGS